MLPAIEQALAVLPRWELITGGGALVLVLVLATLAVWRPGRVAHANKPTTATLAPAVESAPLAAPIPVAAPPPAAPAPDPAPAPAPTSPAPSPPAPPSAPPSSPASGFHGRRAVTRRVFVSSTSLDLSGPAHPYRAVVMDSLLRLDLFPEAMEQFNAQPAGDGTSVSLAELLTCDIYVGIVAWRYGTVPTGQPLSITHQEFRKAKELGRPCFIFLSDPSTEANSGPDDLFPATLRDPDHAASLAAFRAELERESIRDYFTTPDDLGRKLEAALLRHLPPRAPRVLPPPTPGFVGRERELAQLCADLRQGQSVGLSAAVAGMAGVGKSTLAGEALLALAAEPGAFPSGIASVRCEERQGLEGLGWIEDQLLAAWNSAIAPEDIARAATPEAAVDLREQRLRAELAPADASQVPSPALVLLDNVEPELPIARLIDVLAGLRILALITSRHQIASPRLRPLALEVLAPEAAVALFAERYTQWHPLKQVAWDPARDAADAGVVVKILGFLPLAIELAAARAARGQQSVAAVAGEMRQPTVLNRLKDPLVRNASVRYQFERSLMLLTPTQRARFAALGLPEGADWPRPVIERMFAAVPPDQPELPSASDDLDVLVALSLVMLLPAAPGAESDPRVRLHPLLRELAREEWSDQPPPTQTGGITGLLDGVANLVHDHASDFAVLAREEELIAGTLHRAAETLRAPAQVVATVATLIDYLNVGGHWRLGMDLLPLQLAIRREVGDRAGEGTTLNNLGSLADALGRPEEAARYYEQALAILEEIGAVDSARVVRENLAALRGDEA
jgi:hypothetical protein